MDFISKIRKHFLLIPVLLFFAVIFSLVSIVNYYYFRVYGWDLGLFNHTIYSYAHFEWDNPTLLQPKYSITNTLGDHFSLFPIFISPLYWIFGDLTFLIVQIVAILIGGIGIYRFIFLLSSNKTIALISSVYFFSVWGVYSALGFDYHDNVVAAMLVPWLFYFVHLNKWYKAFVILIFMLIAKENMALWTIFISIGMMVLYKKEILKLKVLSVFTLFSLVYFLVVMKVIIPSLNAGGQDYYHNSFTVLGSNFGEVIKTIIKRPGYAFSLLFENPKPEEYLTGIKSELHFTFLISGGIILFLNPEFIFMLLPIYGQKLFNDDYGRWGLNAHYSIEFVPIMAIGIFWWISNLKKDNMKYIFASMITIICILTTKNVLGDRVSKWYNRTNENFLVSEHYTREFDVKAVRKDLLKIPADAKLSAQSAIIPPLAFRKIIYHYPFIGDADYIALIPADNSTFPLSKQDYDAEIIKLKSSGNWEINFQSKELLILKRKQK